MATMAFRSILFLLGLRVRWLARHDRGFGYDIRDKRLVLQMALRGGRGIRWYEFRDGTVETGGGWHPRYAAAARGHLGERVTVLTFASAPTALRIMARGTGDLGVYLSAVRSKELTLDGDFTLFLWFGWLADQLGPRR
ncbi:hypothetical protein [Nocardia rhizosphaerae]|uniref:SCP2 domain-containing protein n=1 Tax=Nocardia rhizosphaerae TaxID=1691571 RepID=A0ABV8L920_9NOCA